MLVSSFYFEIMTCELREGCRTDARAADELSCSPASGSFSALGSVSGSTAYLLAASPAGALALVGVFGDGSTALLV